MMYTWEPVEDSFYPFGFHPEQTMGVFYDALHVEQTNEGWHGMLLSWYQDEDTMGAYLAMLDEQVFPAKYDAVLWCEAVDKGKAQTAAETDDDPDSAEYWEMVLSDEGLFDE